MSNVNKTKLAVKANNELRNMLAFSIEGDDKTYFLETKIAFLPVDGQKWSAFIAADRQRYDVIIYTSAETCENITKSFNGYDEETNSIVGITLDNEKQLRRIIAERTEISAEDLQYIKEAFDSGEIANGTIAAVRLERDADMFKTFKLDFDDNDKIAMICFQIASTDEIVYKHDVELLVDFITSTNCTINEIEPFLASRAVKENTE